MKEGIVGGFPRKEREREKNEFLLTTMKADSKSKWLSLLIPSPHLIYCKHIRRIYFVLFHTISVAAFITSSHKLQQKLHSPLYSTAHGDEGKTHARSYKVVIKVVNSGSYSIFQRGPANRLQSIRKYITEHFPAERTRGGRWKEEKMMELKANSDSPPFPGVVMFARPGVTQQPERLCVMWQYANTSLLEPRLFLLTQKHTTCVQQLFCHTL